MPERLLSEQLSIIATVDADSYSTQTVYTDAFDMAKWRRVMVIALTGTFATAASVVGTMYAGAGSTGAWTTITGKTFTMTEVLLNTNGQAVINLNAAELASTGFRWARLGVALTVATSIDCAAVVLADNGRYAEPWTTIAFGDLSSVDQIIA